MGDFTGFEFGGKHSSELGIIRVSGGDKYEEELQPDMESRTAEVPGLDGSYYFGSDYKERTISIQIAFDSLTESQFRNLRRIFGTKELKKLVFDELPYKYYMAKLDGPIELSYVCFDEPNRRVAGEEENDKRYGVRRVLTEETAERIDEETGESVTETVMVRRPERIYPYELQPGTRRIYKGEGKISFICYFPFAKSNYKQIPFTYQLTTDVEIVENKKYFIRNEETEAVSFTEVENPAVEDIGSYYERVNVEESNDWAFSSGMLSVNEYETVDKYDNGTITIYNPGDVATGFRLYIPAALISNEITITYLNNIVGAENIIEKASLALKPMTIKSIGNISDIGVLIDTNNGLITGVVSKSINQDGNVSFTTSGNLYNEYVKSGYFFKIDPSIGDRTFETIRIEGGGEGIEIYYDYLYF